MVVEEFLHTLRSYEAEMEEMVVMESQGPEDFQAGMVRSERKERQELLDHRDLPDHATVE